MKGAVILLGLIALVGSAVAIALSDFKEDIGSSLARTEIPNETITWVNNTYVATTQSCSAGMACTTAYNASGVVEINISKITCTAGKGIKVNWDTTQATEPTADINVTYQCAEGDVAFNTSNEGLVGVSNTTGYLGTIGTIIGIAILIGIVVLAFTFVRR